MISFKAKPDPALMAIVNQALDVALDELTESIQEGDNAWWKTAFPLSSRFFGPKMAVGMIHLLKRKISERIVYRANNYCWLLLYECLKGYCDVHNYIVRGERQGVVPLGGFLVGPIDFKFLVKIYFHDADLSIPEERSTPQPLETSKTIPILEDSDVDKSPLRPAEALEFFEEKQTLWNSEQGKAIPLVLKAYPPSDF